MLTWLPQSEAYRCLLQVVLWALAQPVLTWLPLVEEVTDGDGNAVAHGRQRGTWVHHAGAKVAQLPSLMVAQAGEADCLRYL